MRLPRAGAPAWFYAFADVLERFLGGLPETYAPREAPTYAVADVPSASPAGRTIYVTDESGGAVLAFSDGTDWRRVTDRAVIS